jgi:hypothetical protein
MNSVTVMIDLRLPDEAEKIDRHKAFRLKETDDQRREAIAAHQIKCIREIRAALSAAGIILGPWDVRSITDNSLMIICTKDTRDKISATVAGCACVANVYIDKI